MGYRPCVGNAARPDSLTTARGVMWYQRELGCAAKKGKGAAQVVAVARDILYGQFIPCPQLTQFFTLLVYTPITPPCSYTGRGYGDYADSGNLLPLLSDSPMSPTTSTAFIYACHAWRWETYKEQGVILVGSPFSCFPEPTQQGHSQWRNRWGFPPRTTVA